MITLKNVDKYYNRRKKSELHVIDNTSLTLEDTGLVALLGSSGSGKTTLLNAIGGLDKIKKGKIYIDDEKISSKFSYKVDKIRNLNIGYIFQDYKLIDDLSVYDNVAIVLKMIGIKDKEEIKKRVLYVLDKVGMLRYKKRPCNMLSGGERQRVGIARAIVKNPKIILADEPTGNLDSKNSLEIMKIIKAISKDKLVILVTHEQPLAKFYASRIIEIKDGKVVKDYENVDNNELDYEIDNSFYLKDFKYSKTIENENLDLNIYSNEKEKVSIDIVVKNGNLYIKSNTKEKVEVVDENSSIEFINDNYKKIEKKDIDKYEFNFEKIIDNNKKKKYSSIFNPFNLILKSFKKVFNYSFLKKLLLLGYFAAGIFIMFSVASIGPVFNIKDEAFIKINKNYLVVNKKNNKVNDFLEYEKEKDINYILPGNSNIKFLFRVNDYYQTSMNYSELSGSLSGMSMINKNDLILGKMPENDHEIVVDKLSINNMLSNFPNLKMSGIRSYQDLLNQKVSLKGTNDFTIVGISDIKSPSIYVDNNMLIKILYLSLVQDSSDITLNDYSIYKNNIEIKKGREPINDYEIIVNIDNQYEMPLNKEIDEKVNNTKLKVVGYYTSKENYNFKFTNTNTTKYNLILNKDNFVISTKNKEETLKVFRNKGLNIKDSYEYDKMKYKESLKDTYTNILIVSGIMLAISFIEMFLMMRSSFLSRIKEVGIYRAIGVKKRDIYRMFYGEIFALTTLSSLPGVIIMAYILFKISKISYCSNMFLINPITVVVSILSIYLFNLLVGLIPVYGVIRKTPAQILSRKDID